MLMGKMDDPGFTHSHTLKLQAFAAQRRWTPSGCTKFEYLFYIHFSFCPAAVWNYSLTSIKPPPLFFSLIKGVNIFPSLAVYYPLGQ